MADDKKLDISVLDYQTLLDMKAIARVRAKLEELKTSGELNEAYAHLDYSKDENLIRVAQDQYLAYMLGESFQGFPPPERIARASSYYRQIKSRETLTNFANVGDIDNFEKTYLSEKVDERDKTLAMKEIALQELSSTEKSVKQNEKKLKNARRKRNRAHVSNVFWNVFSFLFKLTLVAMIFVLPQVTGIGALFVGSTNAFLGTIACCIASYYGLKSVSSSLNGMIKNKIDTKIKQANEDEAAAQSDDAKKQKAIYENAKNKIRDCDTKLKILSEQLLPYDSNFIENADSERVNAIVKNKGELPKKQNTADDNAKKGDEGNVDSKNEAKKDDKKIRANKQEPDQNNNLADKDIVKNKKNPDNELDVPVPER